MNSVDGTSRAAKPVVGLALLLVYTLVRLSLLPADADVTGGFSHDSAYISIVAGQVRDGHGYVNPAHWLLFLNPATLPMPFHNANPLYPTALAAVSFFTSFEPARSGLAVSAIASSLLLLFLYLLLRQFGHSVGFSLLTAAAIGMFPSNWKDSLSILPDALSTALLIAMAWLVARAGKPVQWLWVGAAFALAWLTRSTSALVIPGLLWWMCRSMPIKAMMVRLFFLGAAGAAVISPWLVHNYRVWGTPLRSDSYFYWIQNYAAHRAGVDVDQYWRGLTPPAPSSHVFTKELPQFLTHCAQSVKPLVYLFLAQLSDWSKLAAVFLILIFALATWFQRRLLRTPELQAGAIILVLSAVSLIPRGESFELRYISFSVCTLLIWALLPLAHYRAAWPLAAACGLYLMAVLVPQDARIWNEQTQPVQEWSDFRSVARQVAAQLPGERIISHKPYYFTYYTGVSALSPPASSKADLLNFMNRYQVRHLLLPSNRLPYYYPGGVSALQPEIRRQMDIGAFTLLELP